MKRFIVKVQLSQFPYHTNYRIYNRERTIDIHGDCTEEFIKRMGGAEKKFFWAVEKDRAIEITEEAEWQDW